MTVIVSDTFTDTNGTQLTAHTISPTNTPANSWTNVGRTSSDTPGANAEIQSNAATITSNNMGVSLDVATADQKLGYDWITVSGFSQIHQATLRWQDSSNYWFAEYHVGNDRVRIIERNAASQTVRATGTSIGLASSSTNALLFTVDSSDEYIAYLGGSSKANYTDGTAFLNTETEIAVVRAGSLQTSFDNLTVDDWAGGGGDLSVSVSDSIAASESIGRMEESFVNRSDAVALAESIKALLVILTSASDAASVSEAVAAYLDDIAQTTDSVVVAETVELLLEVLASVSDTVSVAEAVSMAMAHLTEVSEAISLAEAVAAYLEGVAEVSDGIGITESISALVSDPTMTASDSISLSELVALAIVSVSAIASARIFTVPAESRVFIPPAESRIYTPPEA